MRPGNKDLQKQPPNSGSLVHMCNFDALNAIRQVEFVEIGGDVIDCDLSQRW
jgi:hypothetical protein